MKKGENDQKELTAIDICIKRSKEVAQEKKSLITLRSTKTEIMKCSKRFFSEDKLKDLENEIKNSIIELEEYVNVMDGYLMGITADILNCRSTSRVAGRAKMRRYGSVRSIDETKFLILDNEK